MYLFQNPLFEEYLSNYFEGTQKALNEYITLDQFLTIKWKAGVPQFFIHLLSTLTGQPELVRTFFAKLAPSMSVLIQQNIDRVTKECVKTSKTFEL